MECPCHSGESYECCCRPYHQREAVADTAEQLMRSRYAAYALELPEYIIETTHNSSPHWQPDTQQWRLEIIAFSRSRRFSSLTVREHSECGDRAIVEFRAGLSSIDGRDASFRERSRFVRENGRWFFA